MELRVLQRIVQGYGEIAAPAIELWYQPVL